MTDSTTKTTALPTQLQLLVDLCKKKGLKYQVTEGEFEDEIGITFGKWVWHWFSYYKRLDSISFSHSYSQNTGQTHKGTMHAIRTKTAVQRMTGYKFYDSI